MLFSPIVFRSPAYCSFFFFNDPPTTEIYTLSLHDALPICPASSPAAAVFPVHGVVWPVEEFGTARHHAPDTRSEEHTSELQSLRHLVCRLLLEKKKQTQ